MSQMEIKTKYTFHIINHRITEGKVELEPLGGCYENVRRGNSGWIPGGGLEVGLFAQDHMDFFSIKCAVLFWEF